MAILSLFYSIIIPIENLRRILTKEELQKIINKRTRDGRVWFDNYLYREGSMSPADNERIIKFWENKGLVPMETKNGQQYWKDLCLVQFPDPEPTLPCDWVEIFYEGNFCYTNLKGKPRDHLVNKPTPLEEVFVNL
jgi:hypothetical protein